MKLPQAPPPFNDLFRGLDPARFPPILSNAAATDHEGQYRHWDTLHRIPPPDGLTPEEWWLRTKFARLSILKRLPLTDTAGHNFNYALPDPALARLHMIDQRASVRASGEISMGEAVANPATRDRYIMSSLIEEAITSSQLEGAVTSRGVAKEMIRSGRRPRDKSEQMIYNNFQAIQFVRSQRRTPLTPEFVCQLQRIVTDGTLDDPADAGKVQSPDDTRVKVWSDSGQVLHNPPPADQLPERLEAMCRFANGEQVEGFLHPVVRAILLHLWLAYDHPFADGNGRTARALFYWSMLNQGYWLAEYLSISRILTKAPSQYARAFLYTETDNNDATYFLLYQLRVICRAIDEFYEYLKRKMREVRAVEALLKASVGINYRQLALLSHALRNPGRTYTFRSHATSHNVVLQSARTDLLDLEDRGLLVRRKIGKAFSFEAVPDLSRRLRHLASDPSSADAQPFPA